MADTPISPDQAEQEEFEFRARAEEEARRSQEAQHPKFEEPTTLEKAAAVGQMGTEFAMAHPTAAGLGAEALATALPQSVASKIPVVNQMNRFGRGVVSLGQGAVDAAHAYSTSRNAQALADIAHQARMAGQPIDPQKLHEAYQSVAQRVGAVPKAAPVPPAPPTPPVGGVAAQQGETFLQRMAQQFGGMAQRVAPVLNNPVTRAVGTGLNNATPAMAFAMPYQMAAHEMEKIRANPHAPEYANNPYAMQIRGEAPTMGAAGAMNRRRALQQMPSLQQGNE
jgi:hypothetical protein